MTIGRPFKKGQSGNPGGRPKEIAEVKELAREHMPAAIEALVSIMNNPKASDAPRGSAAAALLDRGYGKPQQHITGDPIPYVARVPAPYATSEEWATAVRIDMAIKQGLKVEDEQLNRNLLEDKRIVR